MNPAGKVRCNMETQIRLANHNCNFYRLKARVLLPSTAVMTHSVCVVANPGPLVRISPLRGRVRARCAPCLLCALGWDQGGHVSDTPSNRAPLLRWVGAHQPLSPCCS